MRHTEAEIYNVSLMGLSADDIEAKTAGENEATKWVDLGPVTVFLDSWADLGKIAERLTYLYLCNASDDDLLNSGTAPIED